MTKQVGSFKVSVGHKKRRQTVNASVKERLLGFVNSLDSKQIWCSSPGSCPAFSIHVANVRHIQIVSAFWGAQKSYTEAECSSWKPQIRVRVRNGLIKVIAFTLTEKWVCVDFIGCFWRLSQSHILQCACSHCSGSESTLSGLLVDLQSHWDIPALCVRAVWIST